MESISGAFPCCRGPTIFPFSRSNQRSGVLATFDLRLSRSFSHTGSLLLARLSVILRTRLSAHSFTSPFFHPSRPVASRCFHPFRLPAFRFLSSTRFFSMDITPSRLSIAGTEKFRATQQFVRFFYWLLSYFRHSKPGFPFPLYTSPLRRIAKDNARRQREFYDHMGGRKEGKSFSIIANILVAT